MEYLPNEILEHIFEFVGDKTNISMVCKLWVKIVKLMHNKIHNINYNDSYCLKHHYNPHNITERYKYEWFMNIDVSNNIPKITNKHCLNYILHITKTVKHDHIYQSDWFNILLQLLKIKHISNPKIICDLLHKCYAHAYKIFDYSFINNDPDIIYMILLIHDTSKRTYIYHLIDHQYSDALTKIKHLEDQHIISKTEIYNYSYKCIESPIKTQILEYVTQSINPSFINYLEDKY